MQHLGGVLGLDYLVSQEVWASGRAEADQADAT